MSRHTYDENDTDAINRIRRGNIMSRYTYDENDIDAINRSMRSPVATVGATAAGYGLGLLASKVLKTPKDTSTALGTGLGALASIPYTFREIQARDESPEFDQYRQRVKGGETTVPIGALTGSAIGLGAGTLASRGRSPLSRAASVFLGTTTGMYAGALAAQEYAKRNLPSKTASFDVIRNYRVKD